MEAIKVKINGQDIFFQDNGDVLRQLLRDDNMLLEYVFRAVKSGRLIDRGILPEDADTGNLQVEKYDISHQDFAPSIGVDSGCGIESEKEPESASHELLDEPYSEPYLDNLDDFESNEIQPRQEPVWLPKKKSTAADFEATKLLLQLRGKEEWMRKFQNKKNNKLHLWSSIGQILNAKGFFVGDGKEAGEKCRQKFANLQKTYINFISNQKQTGAGYMEPPPFFTEINEILGKKDKVNPQHLIGSMDMPTPSTSRGPYIESSSTQTHSTQPQIQPHTWTEMEPGGPSTPDVPIEESSSTAINETLQNKRDRNATRQIVKKKISLRPETLGQKILKTMENLVEKTEKTSKLIMQQNKEQSEIFERHFKTTESNEKEFLKIFSALAENIKKNKKKRRHSSSSDE